MKRSPFLCAVPVVSSSLHSSVRRANHHDSLVDWQLLHELQSPDLPANGLGAADIDPELVPTGIFLAPEANEVTVSYLNHGFTCAISLVIWYPLNIFR